jgi:acetoin utilization deacetylase AcuC-like enzyme
LTVRTAYVTHSDCSRHDTGWRHPEHQGRLPAVARAVHRDMLTLFERLLEVEGTPATEAQLRLAHSDAYIANVADRCSEALRQGVVLPLDGEVVVSGASWAAAVAAVGCVLTAVERVQAGEARNAFCAIRPPGHGAGVDRSGAFGLFNSVAIGALSLLRNRGATRVLLVEWGSRRGAGTAEIVRSEERIRFLSLHAEGEGAVDVPVAAGAFERPLGSGSGGAEVLDALQRGMDEAERGFAPDFILLSLGCDALAGDPLGRLALTPRDFYDLTTELRGRAERLCGGRLVSVLEEGYDAAAMGQAVVQHLRALAALPALEP